MIIYHLHKIMASIAKKAKLKLDSSQVNVEGPKQSLIESLRLTREKTAKSVTEFEFNKKRLQILSKVENVPEYCEGIVYWMSRDSRVQDNWAFLFAQKLALKNEVPLHVCFCLVEKYTALRHFHFLLKDAHNIVPCWVASDKQEYSARTIRNKINSKLDDFLTEFPPLIKHPYKSNIIAEKIDWEKTISTIQCDKNVGPVEWAKPGYDEGIQMLQHFLDNKLKYYASKRNDPTEDVSSNLSPWFNFGQISVQRAALCVQMYKEKFRESVNSFLEEAIVRRELADNFCFYNEHYDSVKGASKWAQTTLDEHRKDKRTYIYTLEQLKDSDTHDDLWNAAQKQLVVDGKMHGFLRMYWCKKILEWTPSPEDALKYALYLNDHFSLDGVDPNGHVGCMWSICGVHDQGWASRDVFGKIRYMNYAGCKRKFDVAAFVARYTNKAIDKTDANLKPTQKSKAKKRK